MLNSLSKEQLKKILLEPKNAIVRQYQKLFEMEGVKLTVTEQALEEISELTSKREMGARGLRALLEEIMLEVMYDIPSKTDVKECIIDEQVVRGNKKPTILTHQMTA